MRSGARECKTPQHILLCGDDLVNGPHEVNEIYQLSRTLPPLERFLDEASRAVRPAIFEAGFEACSSLSSFDDFRDLADAYTSQRIQARVVHDVLLFTVQLGQFIKHAHHNPRIFEDINRGTAHIIGLDVGSFAASVAASAQDVDHALKLGLAVIAIVAQLGVTLEQRSKLINPLPSDWATNIAGLDQQTIGSHLKAVNQGRLKLQQAYVAVTTSTGVTVSAPPPTTNVFRAYCDEHGLEWQPPSSVSTSGRHGRHLPPLDLAAVVSTYPCLDIPVAADSLFVSPPMSEGQEWVLHEVLTTLCQGISQEPFHPDQILAQWAASMPISTRTLNLTSLGSTSRIQYLEHALRNRGLEPQLYLGELSSSESPTQGIAIVGMSGRFPGGANDISSFWDLLLSGRTTHTEIRPSRSDVPDAEEKAYAGSFLNNPGDFDHGFFRISPKEALEADPVQRLLLMATYEALQQAGYTPEGTKSVGTARVATFFGQTTTDWLSATGSDAGVHFVKTLSAFAPGRLAQFFGFGGGICTVDTACSSSLKAVHLAFNALKARECDMTIVGGGNICVMPDMFEGLTQGGFLSSSGGCKSFHQNADGYCRGEAVGVLVLKRVEDAMRDNDNILAVIPATATNSNAGYGSSIATPSSEAQEDLFRLVLRRAGIHPHDINAVEMHSPGTQAGDNAEMQSVLSVFANGRAYDNPLFATAVKAAVSHGEGAAGITSLIKAVLMLNHGQVPPQPDQPFSVNRNFASALQPANIKIPATQEPLTSHTGDRRNILVNSFDAAGGNVTVLVQDQPKKTLAAAEPYQDRRSHHLVSCSAGTATAHVANKRRLYDWLLANPDARLTDIAYTTTLRQVHHPVRQAWVVNNVAQLTNMLRSNLDLKQDIMTAARKGPLVFAFTGQGSRNINMGLELYHSSSQFRSLLEAYQPLCDISFLPIWQDQLDMTQISVPQAQVALVVLEIALARFWQDLGLQPQLLIGHSLGEFAALCVAGVISVHEALLLVQARAEAMESLCTPDEYGMLAANVTATQAEELVGLFENCETACFNASRATVFSGLTSAIDALEAKLKADGIPAKHLPVRYGFHSSQMDSILGTFRETARKVHFAPPKLPMVSTLSGEVVQPGTHGVFNADYLCRQMREPVNFVGAVQKAATERFLTDRSIVLELGPDAVCTKLISACFGSHSMQLLPSLQKGGPVWWSISRCLAAVYEAGFAINWSGLYKDYAGKLRLLDLPNYAWDLKRFWLKHNPSRNASTKTIPTVVKNELPRTPGLPSTSVHRLEWLGFEHAGIKALFSSDLSDSILFDAIQGHTVNDTPLFSLSLFVDMAFAAALFLFGEFGSATSTEKLKLSAIQMTQGIPVHLREDAPIVYVHVARVDDQTMSIRLCTRPKLDQEVTHGTCLVSARNKTEMEANWSELQNLWQHRTNLLEASAETHRMNRRLFYKLFGATVKYSQEYNLLSAARVEEHFDYGTAKLDIAPTSHQFACSPWTVEGMLQMSGFLLNANLDRPENDIYIASHVEEFFINVAPTLPAQFDVYAIIRETKGNKSLCDIHVYDGGRLAALCQGIRFTRITRDAFAASLRPTASIMTSSVVPEIGGRLAQKLPAESTAGKNGEAPMPLIDTLLYTLANELGIDVQNLHGDAEFESIGLDSMMSLKVLEKMERITGIQLPAAFFNNCPTVDAARQAFGEDPAVPDTSELHVPVETGSSATSDDQPEKLTPAGTDSTPSTGSPPESRPVLVQGHASSSENPIFLIAAGTGYSDAYMNLSPLASTRPIYCLESPYADDPTLHTANVPAMASIWISTIRRLRSHGPYILGGYSSGAVFAYEIAYQLSEAGESIDALVIMDMHFPRRLTKVYHDLIDQIIVSGFLDFPGISDRLRLHIAANSKAAVGYQPKPMKEANRPGWTEVIWATRGFSERQTCNMTPQGVSLVEDTTMEIDEYLTNARAWFVGKRENFGTNGWDTLLGRKNVGVSRVEGANHATIVHKPYADELGRILREVIDKVIDMEKKR